MIGIAGILLSLGLLIYFAYRGVSVIVLAPLLAALAASFDADAFLLASYTHVFMKGMAGFVLSYFPLFLLGAMFGKLMELSGSAEVIAQWIAARLGRKSALLSIVLACAVLTYGGVSLFVVAFAVYPIAAVLLREAGVPKRLLPAAVALGAFTFTMTALPGTPAIQNAIPMPYFKTTPFAAPGLGLIAGAVMFSLGMAWLSWRARQAARVGEGYGTHAQDIEPPQSRSEQPKLALAALPVVLVIALNYFFSTALIPALAHTGVDLARYGIASIDAVRGMWGIICALLASILVLIACNRQRIGSITRGLDSGANDSVLPIFCTAPLVGFGSVVASLDAFRSVRDAVLAISPGNPLVSLSVAVNILAGITGSASGGMSIALQALGDSYLILARSAGVEPDLLHRVTAIATGGLDALPHNGAVITLLSICKLSHRESYLDIFMVAVVGPILALILVVALGTTFGAF